MDSTIGIDPFGDLRKNSHIWKGARSVIWYHEKMDDSMRLIILYDFGDKTRALVLEIDDKSRRVEFRNNDLESGEFEHLKSEIEFMEKMLREPLQP